MEKPDFCLCENKDADQLCSNCTADQRLCFRYTDSTIPLLLIAKTSNVCFFSETVRTALCRTGLEISKISFLASRLILLLQHIYGAFCSFIDCYSVYMVYKRYSCMSTVYKSLVATCYSMHNLNISKRKVYTCTL